VCTLYPSSHSTIHSYNNKDGAYFVSGTTLAYIVVIVAGGVRAIIHDNNIFIHICIENIKKNHKAINLATILYSYGKMHLKGHFMPSIYFI
jgi:hypothetical protein